MRPLRVSVAMLWLVSAACGGGTSSKPDGTGHAGSAAGGTSGADSECPAEVPKNGSACEPPASGGSGFGFNAADCSWGDDIRPRCRTQGVCNQGKWTINEPGAECAEQPLPAACPKAPAAVASECDSAGLECWYDDGNVCSCSPCQGGAEYPICQTIDPPQWACTKPMAGCPNPPPQAGTKCAEPGKQCGTSCELPIRCEGGVWQYGQEMCPICAAPDTPIATPNGDRAIATLQLGDLVYTVDQGVIVARPIARAGSTPVVDHRVLRIVLDDGAVLEISPQHPLANGTPLSALQVGDDLASHRVVALSLANYRHARTYDILPSSSTGSYFAAGVELGSTLAPR